MKASQAFVAERGTELYYAFPGTNDHRHYGMHSIEYTEPTAARLIICKSRPGRYNAGQKESFRYACNFQSRRPERIQNSDRAA
jgi:hypothetical protein